MGEAGRGPKNSLAKLSLHLVLTIINVWFLSASLSTNIEPNIDDILIIFTKVEASEQLLPKFNITYKYNDNPQYISPTPVEFSGTIFNFLLYPYYAMYFIVCDSRFNLKLTS